MQYVCGWLAQSWKEGTSGTWRQNPKLSGGGQLFDSGAHVFNSLVWTVEQPVESVHAFIDNLDAPVDINGTVNIRFQNGLLATIAISGNADSTASSMIFVFDEGRIECDGFLGRWMRAWKGKDEIEPQLNPAITNVRDNFVDAIMKRAEPQTSPLNGIIQSELMDAISESARTGQVARPARRC